MSIALVLTFLLRLPGPSSPAKTPVATVRAFYAFHFAHDMAFTPESLRAKADWLAPDLLELSEKYFEMPTSPDEAPAIDGDPFTDSQEYPTSFRVGAARVSGEAAWVPVRLAWRHGPSRSVTVHLVRIARRWRVWDVRWPDGASFRDLLAKNVTPAA
jgi:hypothetical protein